MSVENISVEKLFSTEPVRDAKKAGDIWFKGFLEKIKM